MTARLGKDPISGDCYLFVNATRKGVKVLLASRSGFTTSAWVVHMP